MFQVGPIIAGPMAQKTGWRNFWWFNTALIGFTIVCCIFLFPETKYNRAPTPTQTVNSNSLPLKDNFTEQVEINSARNGKDSAGTDDVSPERNTTRDATSVQPSEKLSPMETHVDAFLGRGKPSKAQWKIVQPYEGNFLLELWMPWYLHIFPIVEFAAFVVSWSASSYLTINLTQSQVFSVPPYNFSSTTIGFFNFAPLVGAMIGLLTAGPLSDFIAARLTKRNRGVREPEMRLLAMIPYVILMIIGNVIVAVGYERGWSWKVGDTLSSYPKFVHPTYTRLDHRNHWIYL
jgi:MFS family permease